MNIKELREIAEHEAKYGRYMSIPPYRVKALLDCVEALEKASEWMESLRASGDAGFWSWSEGDEYSQARAALKALEAA